MTTPLDRDIASLSKYQRGIVAILRADIEREPLWLYDWAAQGERLNPRREPLVLSLWRYVDSCLIARGDR